MPLLTGIHKVLTVLHKTAGDVTNYLQLQVLCKVQLIKNLRFSPYLCRARFSVKNMLRCARLKMLHLVIFICQCRF